MNTNTFLIFERVEEFLAHFIINYNEIACWEFWKNMENWQRRSQDFVRHLENADEKEVKKKYDNTDAYYHQSTFRVAIVAKLYIILILEYIWRKQTVAVVYGCKLAKYIEEQVFSWYSKKALKVKVSGVRLGKCKKERQDWEVWSPESKCVEF